MPSSQGTPFFSIHADGDSLPQNRFSSNYTTSDHHDAGSSQAIPAAAAVTAAAAAGTGIHAKALPSRLARN
jgi:hypothetical protein